MSIFIKGVHMPKCCSDCSLEYDQMRCSIAGYNWYDPDYLDIGFDPNEDRLPECPLIEFPEHHGRLIDADALVAESLADGAYGYVSTKQIYDAETIIEADGIGQSN